VARWSGCNCPLIFAWGFSARMRPTSAALSTMKTPRLSGSHSLIFLEVLFRCARVLSTERPTPALTALRTNGTLVPPTTCMNVTRPCVLYTRKSTDREDKQILSIQGQLRELRDFATRSGLTITTELTESCSARKPGRPVFSKLLKDAEAGRVERILAWRLDRLARNPVDGGQLIYLLGENALKELVTPEGTYTGAGDSKFMLSVLFGAATKMTDDLSAGVKRGNKDVLKTGRIPWRPPLGYIKVRDRNGPRGAGKCVPDPERFPILQRMWKEMATGTVTVAALWRRASTEWGLRMRNDAASRGGPLSFSHLYEIFRSPFYYGVIQSSVGTFDGEHVPMVTREEFQRVQQLISPEAAPRPSRHAFAYAGLLFCGACGRLFIGERHVKPSGLTFGYYRCGRRHQGKERCYAPAAREEAVTADVDRELECLVLPEHIAAWTRDALDYWATEQKGFAAERAKAAESQLHAAEQHLARLTDLLVSNLLAEQDFVARRDEAQAQIAALRHAVEQPEAELAAWRAHVEEAITAGCRVTTILEKDDPEARRAFLAQLCANLVVTDRITKPHLRFPFTLLENVDDVRRVLSGPRANRLPPPRTVLSKRKNARRGDDRERALLAWWTKVRDVRTRYPYDD
jgi:site-specific DNA recombinase